MVVKQTENEALWVNVWPDDPNICDYLEDTYRMHSFILVKFEKSLPNLKNCVILHYERRTCDGTIN